MRVKIWKYFKLAESGYIIPLSEINRLKEFARKHPEYRPAVAKIIYFQNKNLGMLRGKDMVIETITVDGTCRRYRVPGDIIVSKVEKEVLRDLKAPVKNEIFSSLDKVFELMSSTWREPRSIETEVLKIVKIGVKKKQNCEEILNEICRFIFKDFYQELLIEKLCILFLNICKLYKLFKAKKFAFREAEAVKRRKEFVKGVILERTKNWIEQLCDKTVEKRKEFWRADVKGKRELLIALAESKEQINFYKSFLTELLGLLFKSGRLSKVKVSEVSKRIDNIFKRELSLIFWDEKLREAHCRSFGEARKGLKLPFKY